MQRGLQYAARRLWRSFNFKWMQVKQLHHCFVFFCILLGTHVLSEVETTVARIITHVGMLHKVVSQVLHKKTRGHFTVVCSVTWPLNVAVTLHWYKPLYQFSCKCKLLSVRTSWFTKPNHEVCIKTSSPEHTTVKWSIVTVVFSGLTTIKN